jgi:hypothetical protein
MPTVTIEASFAPIWLAYALLDDKSTCNAFDEFVVKNIPSNIHGGILLVNRTTAKTYRGADVWMTTAMFLASLWTIKICRFSIVSRDNPSIVLDTRTLEAISPTDHFREALRLGEKAYKEDRARKLMMGQFDEPPEPRGTWVWISDED